MQTEGFKDRSALIVLAILFVVMALLAGVVVGLALGWLVFPVEWVDMPPSSLANVYQEDHLRMVIDSYTLNGDCDLAVQRYKALGESGPVVLEVILDNPHSQDAGAISTFAQCVKK